jgi:PsbP-like protein
MRENCYKSLRINRYSMLWKGRLSKISASFIILLFLLSSIFYGPSLVGAQQDSANFLTYTNTDLGFTIKYPSDWTVNESKISDTAPTTFTSHDRAGQVLISNSNLKPNETSMSWEDLVKNFSKTIKIMEQAGFRPIELNTNNYFLSGHPAVRMITISSFRDSQGISHDLQMMSFTTILEGKKYVVGYGSPTERFDDHLQTAQKMINSFQIINKQ